ncbi:MAG: FAD:protein FMN transferase [Planctomycetota bacterium]
MMAGGGAGLAGLGVLGWTRWASSAGLQTVSRSSHLFGTRVSLTALHASRPKAEEAIAAAFRTLGEVADVLSIYRPDSEVSRLNRYGVLDSPHPHMVTVLRRAQEMSYRSGDAFDVTVQPLWQAFAKAGGSPSQKEIEAARAKVGWLRLDIAKSRIRLADRGMAVTLNGIAQGYAADRALEALRLRGVETALVDTGELGGMGRPWKVGIQHPRRSDAYVDVARLDGRCMATSGDYANPHAHIFDPATGVSPGAFSSVTVVAPSGLDADALSTAIFVAGPERGADLVARAPGADALFVLKDGRTMATKGFPGGGA